MLSRPSPHSRQKANWVGLDRFAEVRLLVALPGWRQHLRGNLGPQRVQRSAKRPTQRIVSTKEEKQGCTPGGEATSERREGGISDPTEAMSNHSPPKTHRCETRNRFIVLDSQGEQHIASTLATHKRENCGTGKRVDRRRWTHSPVDLDL